MTLHDSVIRTFECIGVAAHPHVRASSSVVVLPSLREPTRRQREEVVARLLNLLQLALDLPARICTGVQGWRVEERRRTLDGSM